MLEEEPVYALLYEGRRLDCGIREGWIKATLIKAMQSPDLRKIVLETIEAELKREILKAGQ
jgi:UTP--glucose-1-phosphate uridylyltransferase